MEVKEPIKQLFIKVVFPFTWGMFHVVNIIIFVFTCFSENSRCWPGHVNFVFRRDKWNEYGKLGHEENNSQILVQTDAILFGRNIVGQPNNSQYRWMLHSASVCMHTLLHVVASCCVLLEIVACCWELLFENRQTFSYANNVGSSCFRFHVALRWCYTGRFATTIFSATQLCNVATML